MPAVSPIKIIVIDDHKIVREGIIALANEYPEFSVVGDAQDGATGIDLATESQPDIVLMDITMPGINGFSATRKILELVPDCKIIILSMNTDRQFVMTAFDSGASAYLVKDEAFDELARAIDFVMQGKKYLSPSIAGSVIDNIANDKSASNSGERVRNDSELTLKELAVLRMIADGKSSKDIGVELGISSKTVDAHRQKIMYKLGIRSIAELTKYALKEGITSL